MSIESFLELAERIEELQESEHKAKVDLLMINRVNQSLTAEIKTLRQRIKNLESSMKNNYMD